MWSYNKKKQKDQEYHESEATKHIGGVVPGPKLILDELTKDKNNTKESNHDRRS